MNKKGISLVALVITIIVLIILTAAVVVTGINTPQNTEYAIKMHNQGAVQDAVTLYVMTSMMNQMDNYDPSTAGSFTVPDVEAIVAELANFDDDGKFVTYDAADKATTGWKTTAIADLGINLTIDELNANFTLDNKGVVDWVPAAKPTLEADSE